MIKKLQGRGDHEGEDAIFDPDDHQAGGH